MIKIVIALVVIVLAGIGFYYAQKPNIESPGQTTNPAPDETTKQEGQTEPDKDLKEKDSTAPPPEAPAPSPVPNPSPAPTPNPATPPPAPTPAPEVKTFNITGHNFAFSQNEIRVNKGDPVKINFESTGGFHDWTVEGYGVGTTQVNTGGKASVEFVADKAGTFVFYCSVGTHKQMGMVGQLIVE